MIFRSLLAVLSITALIGCSSDPTSLMRSPSAIKKSLRSLEGKSTDAAIAKLGLPKEEKKIGGRTVWVWYDRGDNIRTVGTTVTPTFGNQVVVTTQTRRFYCNVSAIIVNDKITAIEIESNSVYYCPGQMKE